MTASQAIYLINKDNRDIITLNPKLPKIKPVDKTNYMRRQHGTSKHILRLPHAIIHIIFIAKDTCHDQLSLDVRLRQIRHLALKIQPFLAAARHTTNAA